VNGHGYRPSTRGTETSTASRKPPQISSVRGPRRGGDHRRTRWQPTHPDLPQPPVHHPVHGRLGRIPSLAMADPTRTGQPHLALDAPLPHTESHRVRRAGLPSARHTMDPVDQPPATIANYLSGMGVRPLPTIADVVILPGLRSQLGDLVRVVEDNPGTGAITCPATSACCRSNPTRNPPRPYPTPTSTSGPARPPEPSAHHVSYPSQARAASVVISRASCLSPHTISSVQTHVASSVRWARASGIPHKDCYVGKQRLG
jgi:hypothetical protein